MTTAKEVNAASTRVALVRNPGTPAQRFIRTIDGDRVDQRSAALAHAARDYPGQPLAWLSHNTGTLTPIEENR